MWHGIRFLCAVFLSALTILAIIPAGCGSSGTEAPGSDAGNDVPGSDTFDMSISDAPDDVEPGRDAAMDLVEPDVMPDGTIQNAIPPDMNTPDEPSITLLTPEPSGAKADLAHILIWQDGDPAGGYGINLFAQNLDVTGAKPILVNPINPIGALPTGYTGNRFVWRTDQTPPGTYKCWAELMKADGTVIARDAAPGILTIRRIPNEPLQKTLVYSFVHLKNQFVMDTARQDVAMLINLLDGIPYKDFEITFNWPIAHNLQYGLADDRPGHEGEWLFDPDPYMIGRLQAFANSGGSIGAYDPLAGWHHKNLYFGNELLLSDWNGLGRKAILLETRYQDQVTGDLDPARPGSKRYLDQLAGRPVPELAGNLPPVAFHITRLMGNRVLAQWCPQSAGSECSGRFIDGRDFFEGSPVFWYLGQLTFSHFGVDLATGEPVHRFARQVPIVGGLVADEVAQDPLYYDRHGMPVDNAQFQSFPEAADNALASIRKNAIPVDMWYVFDHNFSLDHLFDEAATTLKAALMAKLPWLGDWTLTRLAHMNGAQKAADSGVLPQNHFDTRFRDAYRAPDTLMEMIVQIMEDHLRYIRWRVESDPNMAFMTAETLYEMVEPAAGQTVTRATLGRVAQALLESLTEHVPPVVEGMTPYVRLPAYVRIETPSTTPGGQPKVSYYTLAEAFMLLRDALVAYDQGGALPESVKTRPALGPTQLTDDRPRLDAATAYTREHIVAAAVNTDVSDPLVTAMEWPAGMVIENSSVVPSYVGFQSAPIRAGLVNAAEFLVLMAKAYLHLQDGVTTDIHGRPARPLSEWAWRIQDEDGHYNVETPNEYHTVDSGGFPLDYYFNHIQLWTFKPAPIVTWPSR